MASRAENRVVNLAGLVQGITLVTFPAAGTIFTDPTEYDLSNTQYGAMFLPQVLTAIATSLLGRPAGPPVQQQAGPAPRAGGEHQRDAGAGPHHRVRGRPRGVPVAAGRHGAPGRRLRADRARPQHLRRRVPPRPADRAVLTLNALLGLGTALAPVFVAVFVGLGFWWGLPVLSIVLLVCSSLLRARLPLQRGRRPPAAADAAGAAASRPGSGCSPGSPSSTGSARP